MDEYENGAITTEETDAELTDGKDFDADQQEEEAKYDV